MGNDAQRRLFRNTLVGTGWAALWGLIQGPRMFALTLLGWMIGSWIAVVVAKKLDLPL